MSGIIDTWFTLQVQKRLTRIRWQVVVYFCRHRGKFAGSRCRRSNAILVQNPCGKISVKNYMSSRVVVHHSAVGRGCGVMVYCRQGIPIPALCLGTLSNDRPPQLFVRRHHTLTKTVSAIAPPRKTYATN